MLNWNFGLLHQVTVERTTEHTNDDLWKAAPRFTKITKPLLQSIMFKIVSILLLYKIKV